MKSSFITEDYFLVIPLLRKPHFPLGSLLWAVRSNGSVIVISMPFAFCRGLMGLVWSVCSIFGIQALVSRQSNLALCLLHSLIWDWWDQNSHKSLITYFTSFLLCLCILVVPFEALFINWCLEIKFISDLIWIFNSKLINELREKWFLGVLKQI